MSGKRMVSSEGLCGGDREITYLSDLISGKLGGFPGFQSFCDTFTCFQTPQLSKFTLRGSLQEFQNFQILNFEENRTPVKTNVFSLMVNGVFVFQIRG